MSGLHKPAPRREDKLSELSGGDADRVTISIEDLKAQLKRKSEPDVDEERRDDNDSSE